MDAFYTTKEVQLHVPIVFRLGHFDLRAFAFRAKKRESEDAKAKVQSCEGKGAKARRCGGEARRCEGESAYVRGRWSDTPIYLSPFQRCTLPC